MKKLIIGLLSLLLLVGCSEKSLKLSEQEKPSTVVIGELKGVKVIKKDCVCQRVGKEYYAILAKNNQKMRLKFFSKDAYDAVQIDNVLDVTYTKDYYIKRITFVNLEE